SGRISWRSPGGCCPSHFFDARGCLKSFCAPFDNAILVYFSAPVSQATQLIGSSSAGMCGGAASAASPTGASGSAASATSLLGASGGAASAASPAGASGGAASAASPAGASGGAGSAGSPGGARGGVAAPRAHLG